MGQDGIKIGKQDGIKFGEASGKAKRDIEIAKNLLRAGLASNLIAESIGLSVEEVATLKE